MNTRRGTESHWAAGCRLFNEGDQRGALAQFRLSAHPNAAGLADGIERCLFEAREVDTWARGHQAQLLLARVEGLLHEMQDADPGHFYAIYEDLRRLRARLDRARTLA